MQHKPAIGVDGPAEKHRRIATRGDFELEIDFLEEITERQVGRPVNHQTQRALLGVFANVDDRAGEFPADHARHGHEELVGQVNRAGRSTGRLSGHDSSLQE